ncbi:putative WRKY transcription factor 75 [Nicotiana tabacum]|uniref:Probable WRKY transcription factor 45 n=1 Tax=Nicotiana tabacum TaxID=4097 RepID=A0A1S4C5P0_TOBAC|nr:PREDICTED: probable WRKY transcription factor 45 [Nicotiana tabacum]
MHYSSTFIDAGEAPPPPPPPPLPPPLLLSNDLSPANFFMQPNTSMLNNHLPLHNNSQVGCDNIDWAGLFSSSINNGIDAGCYVHRAAPINNSTEPTTMPNVSITPRNIIMEGEQQQQQQQHGGYCRDKGKFRKRKYVPPRIAFHTRSTEDILDDGFKWRKYGQKAVKNSTHPRSYYRCTHHTCNVKKQIQRLSKDTSIVVTTYEGIHNHPCEKLMETLSPILKQLQFFARF